MVTKIKKLHLLLAIIIIVGSFFIIKLGRLFIEGIMCYLSPKLEYTGTALHTCGSSEYFATEIMIRILN